MDEQAGHGNRTDAWDSGDAYEPYVGRWSRLVAPEFLEWLAVPPGGRWLDVGCGTVRLPRPSSRWLLQAKLWASIPRRRTWHSRVIG